MVAISIVYTNISTQWNTASNEIPHEIAIFFRETHELANLNRKGQETFSEHLDIELEISAQLHDGTVDDPSSGQPYLIWGTSIGLLQTSRGKKSWSWYHNQTFLYNEQFLNNSIFVYQQHNCPRLVQEHSTKNLSHLGWSVPISHCKWISYDE